MSGKKYPNGERQRCPIHGGGRRLSQANLREIRRAIDIANSRARREGKTPKEAQIIMFSCQCNCFHIKVD